MDGVTGVTPGLDLIMVLLLAPVLAIVDVSLTWIKWFKDAEQARIDQSRL